MIPRWAGALVLASLLAGAPPAAAATAIDLGVGDSPAAVVDPAGTAHVVFNSPGGETYCRLPRTAKHCDVVAQLPLSGRTRGPLILRRPADGALIVVQAAAGDSSGSGTIWARYSLDGGVTWQAPLPIATGSADMSSAALAPDGQSVFALDPDGPGGLTFQRGPFGATEPRSLVLEPEVPTVSAGASSDARIAVLPDGRMLTADFTFKGIHWRMFTGGDPYDISAWARQGTIRNAMAPELVSGRRGTYLLEHRRPLHQDGGALRLRSFDAKRARWRAPRWAVGDRMSYGGSSVSEDAGGRLHAVLEARTNAVGCVIYSRTTAKRSSWFGRSTTLYRTRQVSRFPEDARVAAAPNGRGVAVWQDQDAARDNGHVRVARLRQARGRYRPVGNEFHRPTCPPN